ncbi:MAG: hypothetical protein O3B13_18520 [Planctomycetota bacterium]|nr:hypothetical protein [Planctomycetota bacterium]
MPLSTVSFSTPFYVLMNDKRRIGPQMTPPQAGPECSPIYGFSSKGAYERYLANSQDTPLLTPYPLVAGFLRTQIEDAGDCLKLVVLDAIGPREPLIHASTMAAVLESQQNQTTPLRALYELGFDIETDAYRLDNSSV